jgi:hypothetical protein
MDDFEVKLKFQDSGLTGALLEAMISIRAAQSAMNAIILEDTANKSGRDLTAMSETYDRLYQDFKLRYLADLEMNYSESKQLDLAAG